MLGEGLDHEYAPISGFPAFTEGSARLAFGDDSSVVNDGRVNTCTLPTLMCYKISHICLINET